MTITTTLHLPVYTRINDVEVQLGTATVELPIPVVGGEAKKAAAAIPVAALPPVLPGGPPVHPNPYTEPHETEPTVDPWTVADPSVTQPEPAAEPKARRPRRTKAQIAEDKAAEAAVVPPIQQVVTPPAAIPIADPAAPQFVQVGVDGSGAPVYAQVQPIKPPF